MRSQQLAMCHFVRADQRKKQGYKSDVSLKRGVQIICILEMMPLFIYIDTKSHY